MNAWLSVIGVGPDGVAGLSDEARRALDNAKTIISSKRILQDLTTRATCISWPSPFAHLVETIRNDVERPVVVLATGDPLWFSVGEMLAAAFSGDEIRFFAQISSFQRAAAHMRWSLNECTCLSVHGRPIELLLAHLTPSERLLAIGSDEHTPAAVSTMLTEHGYGQSQVTALSFLGGKEEQVSSSQASKWQGQVPAFHTLALELVVDPETPIYPKSGGLPDRAFSHDGRMTKQVVRAATLAKLLPSRNGLLWDIGAGCGSVAIEWMRSDPTAKAIAIEPRASRRDYIEKNMRNLGTPNLQVINGTAPDALRDLPDPDAVFVGGGLTEELIPIVQKRLSAGGRLVANAVTLESEAVLLKAFERFEGELVRISVSNAEPVGKLTAWRPNMAVTQWSWVKS